MKKLGLLIIFCLTAIISFSTITTATSSGDWFEGSVWDNGVPGCFDTIVIPFGVQVDITSTVDLEACPDSILVEIHGRLEFQNGKKLKLPCFSDVLVYPGGSVGVGSGGGSSTYIEICNTQYWNAGSGDLTGPSSLCDGGCPPLPWALPIELLFFQAEMDDETREVNLYWATATEVDNDFFTIEKSTNGTDWTEVKTVDGSGTKYSKTNYSDVDSKPFAGTSYYRLKQTDFDGEYSYSPIVSVNSSPINGISLYPNPSHQGDQIVVNFPDYGVNTIDVLIYSVDGKIVQQTLLDLEDSHQMIVDIDDSFEPGYYLLRTEFETVRLIIE